MAAGYAESAAVGAPCSNEQAVAFDGVHHAEAVTVVKLQAKKTIYPGRVCPGQGGSGTRRVGFQNAHFDREFRLGRSVDARR